jgi:hypothetical protein
MLIRGQLGIALIENQRSKGLLIKYRSNRAS